MQVILKPNGVILLALFNLVKSYFVFYLLSVTASCNGIAMMKLKSLLFATASVSILAAGCSSDRISGLDRIPAQMNNVYGSYGYGSYSCPSGYSHDTAGWCKKNVSPKIEIGIPSLPQPAWGKKVIDGIEDMSPVSYSMLIFAVASTFLAVTMSRKG